MVIQSMLFFQPFGESSVLRNESLFCDTHPEIEDFLVDAPLLQVLLWFPGEEIVFFEKEEPLPVPERSIFSND